MIKLYNVRYDVVTENPTLGDLPPDSYHRLYSSRSRGYVSRCKSMSDYEIFYSRGKKMFYIAEPCYDTSNYFYRTYIKIDDPDLALMEVK